MPTIGNAFVKAAPPEPKRSRLTMVLTLRLSVCWRLCRTPTHWFINPSPRIQVPWVDNHSWQQDLSQEFVQRTNLVERGWHPLWILQGQMVGPAGRQTGRNREGCQVWTQQLWPESAAWKPVCHLAERDPGKAQATPCGCANWISQHRGWADRWRTTVVQAQPPEHCLLPLWWHPGRRNRRQGESGKPQCGRCFASVLLGHLGHTRDMVDALACNE